jgi:hypothetical protein
VDIRHRTNYVRSRLQHRGPQCLPRMVSPPAPNETNARPRFAPRAPLARRTRTLFAVNATRLSHSIANRVGAAPDRALGPGRKSGVRQRTDSLRRLRYFARWTCLEYAMSFAMIPASIVVLLLFAVLWVEADVTPIGL